jgi:hypothetical protein
MNLEIMQMIDADWSTVCEGEGVPNLRRVVNFGWLIKEMEKNEV